ncbi:acyltransferase [Ancylobacter aquaticus]|nr:acyltransferase [Ancylobacter aquaticus]
MIRGVQYLRGIAALMVVMFHADGAFLAEKYWHVDIAGGWLLPAGGAGVYLFFALSGFVIANAHLDDVGAPRQLSRYIYRRFARIYPIYWIVSLTVLAVGLVFPSFYDEKLASPLYIVGLLTLIPLDGPRGNLAVTWTLFYEVLFYCIFALLIASRRVGITALAAWGLLCAGSLALDFQLGILTSHFNLIFLAGLAMACVYRQGPVHRMILIVGLVVCLAAFAITWVLARQAGSITPAQSLSLGIFGAVFVWALAELERSWGGLNLRLLGLIGDASYSIYLTHYLAISVCAKLLNRFPTGFHPAFDFLLVVASGVASGIMVFIFIERPMLRYARGRGSKQTALTREARAVSR